MEQRKRKMTLEISGTTYLAGRLVQLVLEVDLDGAGKLKNWWIDLDWPEYEYGDDDESEEVLTARIREYPQPKPKRRVVRRFT